MSNDHEFGSDQPPQLLEGALLCGECESPMGVTGISPMGPTHYACVSTGPGGCSTQPVRIRELDEWIMGRTYTELCSNDNYDGELMTFMETGTEQETLQPKTLEIMKRILRAKTGTPSAADRGLVIVVLAQAEARAAWVYHDTQAFGPFLRIVVDRVTVGGSLIPRIKFRGNNRRLPFGHGVDDLWFQPRKT